MIEEVEKAEIARMNSAIDIFMMNTWTQKKNEEDEDLTNFQKNALKTINLETEN